MVRWTGGAATADRWPTRTAVWSNPTDRSSAIRQLPWGGRRVREPVPGEYAVPPWEFRRGKAGEDPEDLANFTVYVTNTGTKYHREGCRHLAKSMKAMTLEQAAKNYEPCSVCK